MDYRALVDDLKNELKISEQIRNANEAIKNFNGFRLHPYIQVFKIEGIVRRHAEGTLSQKWVDDFFIHEFYNLFDPLSFTHGFFGNSKYIGHISTT